MVHIRGGWVSKGIEVGLRTTPLQLHIGPLLTQ